MTKTLYGELSTIADDTAEFTLYDVNGDKQCYARYPVADLPDGTELGDVFTMEIETTTNQIESLEFNEAKTTEFKQQRQEILDELS